jgi:hypothetical protein
VTHPLRLHRLLPLLFILSVLLPWQWHRVSAHADPKTQRFVSTLVGITAGGIAGGSEGARIGSDVALSAEIHNRQLHQREIEWIQKHIGDFSAITGLSPENARRLLTVAGMTLVDAKAALFNAANVQALLDQGFTKEQIAYAQKYLTSNTNGETFHNEFADRDEKLFTVQNPVEYLSGYDPNKPAAGQMAGLLIDEAAASAAVKVIAKTGKVLYKIGGKYYTKLKNGKYLNVSSSITIDPAKVRHSQKTVSFKKKRGDTEYTYDDIKNSMQKEGWQGEPIDVVEMPDGELTSIDNTRVRAAKETNTPIKANIRKHDEPLPDDIIKSGRFNKEEKNQFPQTWGEAIDNRIKNQGSTWSRENPHGTHELPRLTGKPK